MLSRGRAASDFLGERLYLDDVRVRVKARPLNMIKTGVGMRNSARFQQNDDFKIIKRN